jgi:hypothetical protein
LHDGAGAGVDPVGVGLFILDKSLRSHLVF